MDLLSMVSPLMTSPLLYPLLAGLCSLDGVLPMVPSEAAVLATGVFAHGGTPNLLLVVVATALGVFIGDHLAYGLSRSVLGPRLINRFRHVSRAVAAAHRQLDRRPALLIMTSRFLPGGRVTMNLACGTARLPLTKFSPASAIAALAWAAYTAGLGFLGGAAFVENPLLALAVGFGLSFALGGLVEVIRRWTAHRRLRSSVPAAGVATLSPSPEVARADQTARGVRRGPRRDARRSPRVAAAQGPDAGQAAGVDAGPAAAPRRAAGGAVAGPAGRLRHQQPASGPAHRPAGACR
jgi:membrane protein DedA with SNARE-associated domain